MNGTISIVCGDDTFGPSVLASSGCRGGFDFTVLFEESILSIVPAACFLVLAPLRAVYLLKKGKTRVHSSYLQYIKLVAITVYACLQLVILILWLTNRALRTQSSVASAGLNLAVSLGLGLVSYLEHKQSVRPSFLTTFYLFVSAFFDAARVRTHWLLPSNKPTAAVLTASLGVKLALLVFEAIEKRRILLKSYHDLSTENTSNIFSRGLFWWLNDLLLSGFKSIISVDNLSSINNKLSSRSLSSNLQARWDKCHQTSKNSLAIETMISFSWDVLHIFMPRMLLVAFNIAQPFLINAAVNFVQADESVQSNNIGYGLIGGFGFVYIGTAITTGWYEHITFRLMAKIRSALIAVIYHKLIELQYANTNESAAMTLMGTEVDRICESLHYAIAEVVPNIIQLGIAVWLLERQLGAVCVAPVIVTLVATALSMKAATFVTSRQKIWLVAIQDRINFTSEIMGSMTNVKMLGLTEKMTEMIQAMRISEMDLSKRFRRLSSLNVCIVNLPTIFSQVLTFAAFAIVSKVQGTDSLSLPVAITSLSILTLLNIPMMYILIAIPQGLAALGCFQRIQDFLLEVSRKDKRLFENAAGNPVHSKETLQGLNDNIELDSAAKMHIDKISGSTSQQNHFSIRNGSFGWSELNPHIVQNIQVKISMATHFTIIVGSVGCGKSTFLKALLGETLVSAGSLSLTHRDIAFCDQTPWITNDSIRNNILGESIYEDKWYQSVICACALDVDLERMPNGDATLLGSKGVILSGGQKQRLAIARAVYAKKDLAIFDDVFSGLDTVTEEMVFGRVFGQRGLLRQTRTAVILATHGVHRLSEADHIIVLGKDGQILEQGTFGSLSTSEGYIKALDHAKNGKRASKSADVFEDLVAESQVTADKSQIARTPDDSRQSGDWRVYKYYTASLGWISLLIFAMFISADSTFGALQYLWLNWWAQSKSSSNLGYWIGIYSLFGALKGVAMSLSVFFMYVVIVPKSAKNLHWIILKAAMSAPMSFFVSTETGVLVNRFSQDMRLVDMTLPGALVNLSFQLGGTISMSILVVIPIGYFAVALPFVASILYLVQRFYLRTSRQLRLLEIETKAPLYSHFIETLNGLITIRAFGWQEVYENKVLRLLDLSQKPFYLLLCIQRWLVLVLDLVAAAMGIILISLAVALRSKTSAGLLGIALVNIMGLAQTLAALITSWTSLETSLGAISRIKSFSEETPDESLPTETFIPNEEWPADGFLKFEGVSASYDSNKMLTLNNINLTIQGGQKIGICGRTGSGKSSFLLSILRMIELSSGKITLDGHDTSTIPRSLIRQKLICLTQQPFLFTGSVRLNADPLSKVSDLEISDALKKVELWEPILRKVGTDGEDFKVVLDANMDENFFSHGQRQLFCLARAMLKKGSILLLDEPTSSVDIKTDAQMQRIIRSEFKHHTIIMIAHRLDTLLDFDRVAVLDKGSLMEFGEPRRLLEQDGSAFSKLYHG